MAAEAAAVAAAAPPPTAAEERELSFVNSRGERLVAALVDTGSKDLVVLCHGYTANMNNCQFPLLAQRLAEAGLSSLRFDHPCATYSKSERQGPFVMGNHEEEAQDMADAVAFAEQQLGKRVICLLGHSKGGINVVLFAARFPGRVPKLVNLAGRFKCRDGTLQRFGTDILQRLEAGPVVRKESWGEWTMTLEDVMRRVNMDMEGLARSIPPATRMLCLHGTADKTIPWEESKECAALVPNAQLQLVEGADHNFNGQAAGEEMARQVVDFVLS